MKPLGESHVVLYFIYSTTFEWQATHNCGIYFTISQSIYLLAIGHLPMASKQRCYLFTHCNLGY